MVNRLNKLINLLAEMHKNECSRWGLVHFFIATITVLMCGVGVFGFASAFVWLIAPERVSLVAAIPGSLCGIVGFSVMSFVLSKGEN